MFGWLNFLRRRLKKKDFGLVIYTHVSKLGTPFFSAGNFSSLHSKRSRISLRNGQSVNRRSIRFKRFKKQLILRWKEWQLNKWSNKERTPRSAVLVQAVVPQLAQLGHYSIPAWNVSQSSFRQWCQLCHRPKWSALLHRAVIKPEPNKN